MEQMIPEDARALMEEFGAEEFRPFAFYDKPLDCIRVRIADCSMSEKRMNRFFTIVTDVHTGQMVGFNIKGIRFILEKAKLPPQGVYVITDLIDEIVKVFPERTVEEVANRLKREIGQVMRDAHLEVTVGEAA